MDIKVDNVKLQLKENINLLIHNGQLEEAISLLNEYKKIVPDDVESYSIDAVILIIEDKLEEAEAVLKEGLARDNKNFDILYNLGYLYEKKSFIDESLKYYKMAFNNSIIEEQKSNIKTIVENLERKYKCCKKELEFNKEKENNYESNDLKTENVVKYFNKEIEKYLLEYFKKMDFNKIINEIQVKISNREYGTVISICDYWIRNANKNTAIIYYFMGVSANGIKDFSSALEYHKKALEIDNTLADLRNRKSSYQHFYKEKNINCIGCGNENYEVVNVSNQSISEDNKELINPIRRWVKCKNCGLIYANPMPLEDVLNKYYSVIAKEKFGGIYGDIDERLGLLVDTANVRLSKIERYTGMGKSVLDIGTGIGIFTGVALDRGWAAEGLEFTPEDCQYAKEKFDLDLKQENYYFFKEDRKYDVVTLFEVIEHLHDPLNDLKRINKLIKNDGMLVVATPIQDTLYGKKMKENNVFWDVVTHLSYFTKDVMIRYLEEAGFKVIEINSSNEGMGRMEFYCRKL